MSYDFDPNYTYRMPTHFGPSLGPRQKDGGGLHGMDEAQTATSVWVSHAVEREQIARLLPKNFEPGDTPDLTVEVRMLDNIGWLAGRGYNLVFVSTAVRWLGGDAPRDGRFKLLLWENMADPILTGREELGYPKVFADIPSIVVEGSSVHASASWDGFTFLNVDVDLSPNNGAAIPIGESYHLHYMPRIGSPGSHSLVQTIRTEPGQGAAQVSNAVGGTGAARFTAGSFAQLPTLKNIVDSFAHIDLGSCLGAGYFKSKGAQDLRHQTIVAED